MSVILAISFAFAVITLSVSGSMIKTNDVFRKTTYGEWQLILPGINSKLKGAAANSDWLDELGVMNVYGTIGEAILRLTKADFPKVTAKSRWKRIF